MNKDGTVGFDRIVTHERAREAVHRFCNAWFNRDPHKPRPLATIPLNEDDDDVVLMDYIAQRQAAEATPNFDEDKTTLPDEVR